MAVDVYPEELVRLGLIEGTFSNISLGIVQQFHSVARHFGGGRDREKESDKALYPGYSSPLVCMYCIDLMQIRHKIECARCRQP